MKEKVFVCEMCGNMVSMIKDSKVPLMCCGSEMNELEAGVVEAAVEKHIPEFEVVDNVVNVKVGEVNHPMLPEHFIEWVTLETTQGIQRKKLEPGVEPTISFVICEGDEVEAVYAYCNIHGLWKK